MIDSNTLSFADPSRTNRGQAATTFAQALSPAQRKAIQTAIGNLEESQPPSPFDSPPSPLSPGNDTQVRRGVSFSLAGAAPETLQDSLLGVIGTPSLGGPRPYSEPSRTISRPNYLAKSVSDSHVSSPGGFPAAADAHLPKAVARAARRSNPELGTTPLPDPPQPYQPYINSEIMRDINGGGGEEDEDEDGLVEPYEPGEEEEGGGGGVGGGSEIDSVLKQEPDLVLYYFYLRYNEQKL
jgi:hypothetical protein